MSDSQFDKSEKGSDTDQTPRHRPGPFGPARALLPRGRRLQFIDDSSSTAMALELLLGDGDLGDEFELDEEGRERPRDTTKLPPEAQRVVLVRNNEKEVIGVFT